MSPQRPGHYGQISLSASKAATGYQLVTAYGGPGVVLADLYAQAHRDIVQHAADKRITLAPGLRVTVRVEALAAEED